MPVSFTLVALLLGADPTARFGGSPADPIPPDEAAAIALDTREAQDEVAKKYGNKKPSELSNDERSQMIKDQAAAEKKVLDKHGVSPSTWARQQMAQSPKEAAAQKERVKALEDKRKADAEAAEKEKEKPEKPIEVQRGISDSNPVTLEENPSAGPVVEEGLPAEAASDQAEAAGQESGATAPVVEDKPAAKAPAKGGKGKGGGKR